MVVEQVTPKEEIAALRKLLREALVELRYRTLTDPSSSASDILERGVVGLGISERELN